MSKVLNRFLKHMESADLVSDKTLPPLVRCEGLIRYKLASIYSKEKTILDIGCGYGYGSYILSQKARLVIGVDINRNYIISAEKNYHKGNLNFICADVLSFLKNTSMKFDIITMFEVMEHVWHAEKLLHLIRNSLLDRGRLFLSTPNKKYTPVFRRNPYHVRELTYLELRHMFEEMFVLDFEAGQIPGAMTFLPIPWLCLGLIPHSSLLVKLNNNPKRSRTILMSGLVRNDQNSRARSWGSQLGSVADAY